MKAIRNYGIKTKKHLNDYSVFLSETIEELNMSHGNSKLVENEKTMFLVWNIPAVKTCPNATEHCKGLCYALKAERLYPNCFPTRKRNLLESMKSDFVKRAIFTILKRLANDKKRRKLIVRIHESGDFYSMAYAQAWLTVADYFKSENVTFIAYTKSFRFFDGVTLPKNFMLRASIWDDTKPEDIETIKRNGWNIYSAVDSFEKGDTFTRCRCSDCATCGKCWKNFKDIRCEIH